jgi:hypothetical protein
MMEAPHRPTRLRRSRSSGDTTSSQQFARLSQLDYTNLLQLLVSLLEDLLLYSDNDPRIRPVRPARPRRWGATGPVGNIDPLDRIPTFAESLRRRLVGSEGNWQEMLELVRSCLLLASSAEGALFPLPVKEEVDPTRGCPIAQLPPELLRRILSNARDGYMDPDPADVSYMRHRPYSARPLRPTDQVWVQSLALVSKSWSPVARAVGLYRLYLSHDSQMRELLQLFESRPELAQHVQELDIDLYAFDSSHIDRHHRDRFATPPADKANKLQDPLLLFLERCTSLVKLDAYVRSERYIFGHGWPQFLEPALQSALCRRELSSLGRRQNKIC